MNKYVKSENGNTLMIVLGFVIVLSLVIAPLALKTSNGLLQAKSGGLKEAAYSDAHSAMTLFAKLYEEAKVETEFAFGGLESEEEWIKLMDGAITARVLSRYPNVEIHRETIDEESYKDSQWIFSAKEGPTVVSYNNSGAYYRSGQVVFSLNNGASGGISNPLPTMPPATDGGGENEPPTMPLGGKIMLKAVGENKEKQYNKMFVTCKINGNGEGAVGNTAQALLPQENYFDNRHDDERAGTADDPKFDQVYGSFRDYYTNINDRVHSFPFYAGSKKGNNDPRLETAKSINENNLTGSQLSVPASAWSANWNGNVEVNGKMNDSSVRTHVFSQKIFVGGNLVFKPKQNEALNVDVQINEPSSSQGVAVGGNLIMDAGGNNAKIIIGSSTYVRGNVDIKGANNWEVTIKGDLVVGGNFDLNIQGNFKHLTIEGDLIVGGNVGITGNSSGKLDILGSMQVQGDIYVNPSQDGMNLSIRIGRDLLSGGDVNFTKMFNQAVTIGRNFAAQGNIYMNGSNGNGHLSVGNHMLSNGHIRFSESKQVQSVINVGGTMAATGDVYIRNNVNGTIVVKDNIIVGGNLGLPSVTSDSMDGKLLMESANLIVFGNASFGRNLKGKYGKMLISGIAIKGFVEFYAQDYTNTNSAIDASICITGVTVS